MKLTIFGDSFGDDHFLWPRYYKDVGPSWIEYVAEKTNYEIDTIRGKDFYFNKLDTLENK